MHRANFHTSFHGAGNIRFVGGVSHFLQKLGYKTAKNRRIKGKRRKLTLIEEGYTVSTGREQCRGKKQRRAWDELARRDNFLSNPSANQEQYESQTTKRIQALVYRRRPTLPSTCAGHAISPGYHTSTAKNAGIIRKTPEIEPRPCPALPDAE